MALSERFGPICSSRVIADDETETAAQSHQVQPVIDVVSVDCGYITAAIAAGIPSTNPPHLFASSDLDLGQPTV